MANNSNSFCDLKSFSRSVRYDEIFHERKANEMSHNISREMSMIGDLSYSRRELRTRSRVLDNHWETSQNISRYA